MNRFVDIHFRAEGDDPRIATLHDSLGASLEKGWTQPICNGSPMSDGSLAPTSLTSIVIAEEILDTPASRMANPSIITWLTDNQEIIRDINCSLKLIQVSIYLQPNAAYDGFYFDVRTISMAAKLNCGLEVMTYRLIKNEEAKECQHAPPAGRGEAPRP